MTRSLGEESVPTLATGLITPPCYHEVSHLVSDGAHVPLPSKAEEAVHYFSDMHVLHQSVCKQVCREAAFHLSKLLPNV
jgi:hypothetical protein